MMLNSENFLVVAFLIAIALGTIGLRRVAVMAVSAVLALFVVGIVEIVTLLTAGV